MRRRIPYRVCQCMPNGVMTHLEARLLKDIVNQAIHPIRCAESCKWKFMRGMRIGDLCAETGHFWWALKVWQLTANLIENKDYDDWRHVWFDNNRVSLNDVISETEYELLSRRQSDLWRALGFPEYAWWTTEVEHFASHCFGTSYHYLFSEKYDGYYEYDIAEEEAEIKAIMREQDSARLFSEAQGDNLPPCLQDFDEFW